MGSNYPFYYFGLSFEIWGIQLSLFVYNDFRVCTITTIFADKQKMIICNKSVTSIAVFFFKLITEIYFLVIK